MLKINYIVEVDADPKAPDTDGTAPAADLPLYLQDRLGDALSYIPGVLRVRVRRVGQVRVDEITTPTP